MDIIEQVEKTYKELLESATDISGHLSTLQKYAQECDHVTEMGVRWVVSSYSFATARPKTFISIDIKHPKEYGSDRLLDIEEYCKKNKTTFSFILGDTTQIKIEETDLLFIDTAHCYAQLKIELKLHAHKVKKYIIFHDTETFGYTDEQCCENNKESKKKGLLPAIKEFLESNHNWKTHEVFTHCNGLTILKRSHGK